MRRFRSPDLLVSGFTGNGFQTFIKGFATLRMKSSTVSGLVQPRWTVDRHMGTGIRDAVLDFMLLENLRKLRFARNAVTLLCVTERIVIVKMIFAVLCIDILDAARTSILAQNNKRIDDL